MNLVKRAIRYMALEKGRLIFLYLRVCRPSSLEYAEYMRRHGNLYEMGQQCSVNIGINITDPQYVRVGDNCALSACTLLGHDAVVRIIFNATGRKMDSVGKIDIRDNSFVGHGAIVMPGVTIGPNSVVAAGSVVTKDVPPDTVVGGVPAKVICGTAAMIDRIEARSRTFPWHSLILTREGALDLDMEPELVRQRVKHFFG